MKFFKKIPVFIVATWIGVSSAQAIYHKGVYQTLQPAEDTTYQQTSPPDIDLYIGGGVALPYGLVRHLLNLDSLYTGYNYRATLAGSYKLFSFESFHVGIVGFITYLPTACKDLYRGWGLYEQHFKMCPAINFIIPLNTLKETTLNFSFSIGYEFDYIFSSKLIKNQQLYNDWLPASRQWSGNIIVHMRSKILDIFYLESFSGLPILDLYHYGSLTKGKKKNRYFVNLLNESRIRTTNWIDVGFGVNLIRIFKT
jgi:hypothetical protein